jgi:hypothetical protein
MNDLEKAFVDFLERRRGNSSTVEVRVRDIRDALGEIFIREGEYGTSRLTSEVAALVRQYRAKRRLERISPGTYVYAFEPTEILKLPIAELQRKRGIENTEALRPAPVALQGLPERLLLDATEQHFSSVAQLAASNSFLVVQNLDSINLEALNGLSF